jgi:uncharacterized membrane protein YqgA involved in biofilm formation
LQQRKITFASPTPTAGGRQTKKEAIFLIVENLPIFCGNMNKNLIRNAQKLTFLYLLTGQIIGAIININKRIRNFYEK